MQCNKINTIRCSIVAVQGNLNGTNAEEKILGYTYTTKDSGNLHNPNDLEKVVDVTQMTWSEMLRRMLPPTIGERLTPIRKRHSRRLECERWTDCTVNLSDVVQYSGLPGVSTYFSMESYNFYYIPHFSVDFSRKVPGKRLPHTYNIYAFLGGNPPQCRNIDYISPGSEHLLSLPGIQYSTYSTRKKVLHQQSDDLVERTKNSFYDLKIRQKDDENSHKHFFRGDGRATSIFETFISIAFSDPDSFLTIHVNLNPEKIGKKDFLTAEASGKPVSFTKIQHFFPFTLDQSRLKNDSAYQQRVYNKTLHFIIFGEDIGNPC